jgi:hypothetical protein
MDATVKDAVLVASLWAGIILAAGLATVVILSRATPLASSGS